MCSRWPNLQSNTMNHYEAAISVVTATLTKERDELKAQLELSNRKIYEMREAGNALRQAYADSTTQLESAQKREAEMREALLIAKRAIGWDSLDNEKVMGPIRAALQPDAGSSEYIRRDAVKPLVEALQNAHTIRGSVDKGLAHAKTLGLL